MALPLPGSPGSSWPMFKERMRQLFAGASPRVCIAFWLFGQLMMNASTAFVLMPVRPD